MKRRNRSILALLLLAALLVSTLTGCFRADDAPNEDGSDSDTLTNEIDQPTEEPTEEQTEEQTEAETATDVYDLLGIEMLSEEKQKEMSDAWQEQRGFPLPFYFEDENGPLIPLGYYGTFGEYIVFGGTLPGNMYITVPTTKKIAESTFSYGTGFSLMVYRNGEFTNLSDAYDAGLFTDSEIALMAERHELFWNNYWKFR